MKWDWFSANWWPGISITVGIVGWAVKSNAITLSKLGKSEIPAFEYLMVTKGEGLWSLITFGFGVSNNSSILKSSNPMYCGPVSNGALWSFTVGLDINTESGHIEVWAHVLVIITVWAENIRCSLLFYVHSAC
jgi:hypothetical protein